MTGLEIDISNPGALKEFTEDILKKRLEMEVKVVAAYRIDERVS